MQLPRTLLAILALVFFAVSALALHDRSYWELWALIGQDSGTIQLFVDLTVAMVLVTTWMGRDSRQRGQSAWPWIGLTVLGGSMGPLAYLAHRAWKGAPARPRTSLLSHLSLGVGDLERSCTFYDAVLAPLGGERSWSGPTGTGYGPPGQPDQLALFPQESRASLSAGPGSHLALRAPDRAAVDAFHAAALAHGGRSEGPPGPRPQYGPHYYAAFVRDPDGHKLEAVHG